jgi:predicted NAD/FAD-dependent oxidoreductase
VVGAGLAGLSAARRLSERGVEVVVFEKARGPGGRTSTRRAEGYAFDHGAQYFTCRDRAFEALVRGWLDSGVAAEWKPRIATLDRGVTRPVSESTKRYVGVPRMSSLGRDLAGGLRVELGVRIQTVTAEAAGWCLQTGQGEVGCFDGVLVATPAPQAVPLLAGAPEMAERVDQVEMEPCWAVMVTFAAPLETDFDAAWISSSPLAWIARNASKPGRPEGECWVLHASPEWTAANVDEPADRTARALLEALAAALRLDLPTHRFAGAHRWLYARTSRPLGAPFLYDPAARIGACGDWGAGGQVESAVLSGAKIAHAVLESRDAPD